MNTEDIYSTNGQDQRKSWECKMERKKKKKAQDESTKDQNREKGWREAWWKRTLDF